MCFSYFPTSSSSSYISCISYNHVLLVTVKSPVYLLYDNIRLLIRFGVLSYILLFQYAKDFITINLYTISCPKYVRYRLLTNWTSVLKN